MALDREIIGTDECFDCGAAVNVKVNKNRRAYYNCHGELDVKKCGAHVRWSQATSASMIAAAAKASRGATGDAVQTEEGAGE